MTLLPPPPLPPVARAGIGRKTGTETGDQTCICVEHVTRSREIVFALDFSFDSVAVGFAILCSHRWILVNLNASTVAFIEI